MTIADLIGETVEDRCPVCGKRMLVDLGPDVFGRDGGVFWCPSCDAAPQVSALDAANIRPAVAAVCASSSNSRRGQP